MKLHRNFQTALGARNLALNLDAPRFRHLDQAIRDAFATGACLIILVMCLDILFGGGELSRALRGWWS